MNLSQKATSLSLLVAIIILIAGCNKLYDYIKNHPGGVDSSCRIDSMTNILWGTDIVKLRFNYNKLGNPVLITSEPTMTGFPERKFKYDQKNRLREFIAYYGDSTNFWRWITYYYDKNDRVTHDTGYFQGFLYPDGTRSFLAHNTVTYEYDFYGRISKTTTKDLKNGLPPEVRTYEYDVNGNLKRKDGTLYDNKTHFRRTNKVWMFLDKDYSVNNSFTANQYNKKGLPVQIRAPFSTHFLFEWSIEDTDIFWGCR